MVILEDSIIKGVFETQITEKLIKIKDAKSGNILLPFVWPFSITSNLV